MGSECTIQIEAEYIAIEQTCQFTLQDFNRIREPVNSGEKKSGRVNSRGAFGRKKSSNASNNQNQFSARKNSKISDD